MTDLPSTREGEESNPGQPRSTGRWDVRNTIVLLILLSLNVIYPLGSDG
jgi:hypothetical protein